jgi:hypothetical protein
MPRRDVFATVLIGVAVLLYMAWAAGVAIPWLADVKPVALLVLLLGVAASMSAVIPGWDELVHEWRLYFAAASVVGLVALVAGVWAIVAGEPAALGLMVLVTVVLWAMSTFRHIRVHRLEPHPHSP